jgi:diacylglycerol kinase (ATP)
MTPTCLTSGTSTPCLVILPHRDNKCCVANFEKLIQEDLPGPLDKENLNTSGELFK